ncbi:MAG: hypothetical protein J4G16_09240 [Acidobacteria bacterium]|nr:hypothetical protein [Acidobacteriota bacterium]
MGALRRVACLAFATAVGAGVASTGRPALAQEAESAPQVSAGDGTLYLGGFPSRIFVIDEATTSVIDEIAVPHGSPRAMVVSEDGERFYFLDPTMEYLTTVDVASREVTDSLRFSAGNRTVRIRGFRVAPDGRTAILNLDAAVKLIDRFEVEPYRLVEVDLETHEILQDLPWPAGEPTPRTRFLYSPDGEYVYHFGRDVIVLETEGFTQVDRWSLREPVDPGVGPIRFGFSTDLLYEEPGFFTNLFTLHDEAQDRELMGIARIDLPNREVDFYTLGPARGIQFALAPGRRTAYGLQSSIEGYEFWTFDLEQRRIGRRRQVAGRPRMALDVSTNGEVLYISSAGNTIDFYDAASFDYLDTLALDGDMTSGLIVVPSSPAP